MGEGGKEVIEKGWGECRGWGGGENNGGSVRSIQSPLCVKKDTPSPFLIHKTVPKITKTFLSSSPSEIREFCPIPAAKPLKPEGREKKRGRGRRLYQGVCVCVCANDLLLN